MQPPSSSSHAGNGNPSRDDKNNNNNNNKNHLSRSQQFRQQQELEERRKFGLAPLAVDAVTKAEISPNVPQSISQAPWYYGTSGPTLAHQRKLNTDNDGAINDSVDMVQKLETSKKFVAGACKNCGSRTHKTRECIQAKKRVGAHYSGVVTGVDVHVDQTAKTYAQKRDRFVGDMGVDLLKGLNPSDDGEKGKDGESGGVAQRHRPEDVFGSRTAQHGGVEIKELPKYLQNLDAQDELFFDPKTGSMRGNPNMHDPSKAFQGDLSLYRSGDYYNYVEAQHRYLTGQSKTFVDFAFDDAMRTEQQPADQPPADGHAHLATPSPSPQDALVRAIYGETAQGATARLSKPAVVSDLAKDSTTAPQQPASTTHQKLQMLLATEASLPLRGDHTEVFGSYFNVSTHQWGYKCCSKVTRDDAQCAI